MDKMNRILSRITAGLILILAIALILSCVQIYESGSRPFNREIIAQYASKLAILGLLCLVCVITGLLLPKSQEKAVAIRDLQAQLNRYQEHLPEAKKEQSLRKTYRRVFRITLVALSIAPVLYFMDSSHFGITDVNGDILRATMVILIPTIAAMALHLSLQHLTHISIRREIELYRSNDIKPGKAPEKENFDPRKLKFIRISLLVASIALVVIGAFNGGAADVLGKAIRICTECIGLG